MKKIVLAPNPYRDRGLVLTNRAKELLRSTNLSISEVCYQVGYQDIRTFNRVFKRVAALRPGEFKKLYGTSGGPVR